MSKTTMGRKAQSNVSTKTATFTRAENRRAADKLKALLAVTPSKPALFTRELPKKIGIALSIEMARELFRLNVHEGNKLSVSVYDPHSVFTDDEDMRPQADAQSSLTEYALTFLKYVEERLRLEIENIGVDSLPVAERLRAWVEAERLALSESTGAIN